MRSKIDLGVSVLGGYQRETAHHQTPGRAHQHSAPVPRRDRAWPGVLAVLIWRPRGCCAFPVIAPYLHPKDHRLWPKRLSIMAQKTLDYGPKDSRLWPRRLSIMAQKTLVFGPKRLSNSAKKSTPFAGPPIYNFRLNGPPKGRANFVKKGQKKVQKGPKKVSVFGQINFGLGPNKFWFGPK